MSAMQTFMPDWANRIAAVSPIPDAPPVMTATLSADMAACGMWVLRGSQDCADERLNCGNKVCLPCPKRQVFASQCTPDAKLSDQAIYGSVAVGFEWGPG
jgi:hypothetical protein